VVEVGVSVSKWFRLAIGVLLVCLVSASASAQQLAPPAAPSADNGPVEPKMNIMFGYAYMKDNSWKEHLLLGWVTALSYRLTPNLYIVGEAGGSHGEKGTTGFTIQRYAFLGGVKLSGGEGRLRPFFHVLGGYSRQGGDVGIANGLIVQPGGGVDFALTEKINLRGQGDFRFILENSQNETGQYWTSYRFSGGLVIYLGKKTQ
jgi:hypothetical protein